MDEYVRSAEESYDLFGESCQLYKLDISVREHERTYRSRELDKNTGNWVNHPYLGGTYFQKGVKDLTQFIPGLRQLKSLRGLTEVIIRDVDMDGQELVEANQTFGEGLIAVLNTPKLLLEGEKVDEVPAKRLAEQLKVKWGRPRRSQ